MVVDLIINPVDMFQDMLILLYMTFIVEFVFRGQSINQFDEIDNSNIDFFLSYFFYFFILKFFCLFGFSFYFLYSWNLINKIQAIPIKL